MCLITSCGHLPSQDVQRARQIQANHAQIEDQGQTLQIWEIARAITDSTFANQPVRLKVGTEKYGLVDGSEKAYNPSFLAYFKLGKEAPLSFLFSIGTDHDFDHDFDKRTRRTLKSVWRPKTEKSLHELLQHVEHLSEKFKYLRIEVKSGIDEMKFDEWEGPHGSKTIQRIENATQQLLADPEVKEDITKYASTLIETRRARALSPDLDRWRRFCDQD